MNRITNNSLVSLNFNTSHNYAAPLPTNDQQRNAPTNDHGYKTGQNHSRSHNLKSHADFCEEASSMTETKIYSENMICQNETQLLMKEKTMVGLLTAVDSVEIKELKYDELVQVLNKLILEIMKLPDLRPNQSSFSKDHERMQKLFSRLTSIVQIDKDMIFKIIEHDHSLMLDRSLNFCSYINDLIRLAEALNLQ
jgi:hypothetical protein